MIRPDAPRPALSPILARFTLALALPGLALSACSPGGDDRAAPARPEAYRSPVGTRVAAPGDAASEVAEPVVAATGDRGAAGGDGSPIRLTGLSKADIESAQLAGELACSFREAEDAPLLFARGNVGSAEPVQGVVKVGDYVEPVGAAGGFNGMLRGATFTGKGKTVRIAPTAAATAGGESPPQPATLTYQRADGASRTIAGRWTCGP